MRVVAGKARGLTLKTLEGDSTRPTRDMVREALFSILMNQIPGCTFLDLFAGSGAIGIEALSRGAGKAYFGDLNKEAIKVIKANLERARMTLDAEVLQGDYLAILDRLKSKKFDIIFIDPPYHKGMGVAAIDKISQLGLLNADGVIVYETDTDEDAPEEIGSYKRYDYRKYGRNRLNFYC
ncbi:MAG: 16S rRNA (guanine(966)-N(2))-methyltransferase RsmD [Clostridia bacterium]|nr:16S rRNA (guanine(966)-N(2))-methyltransferase RsmD [Clostridia bacterium]